MLSYKTEVRVRFSDTDKMQFAYHAKYVEYFEMGRTEMLRAFGLPYAKIEEMGYEMPVLEVLVKFRNAAFYDEVLVVESILRDYHSPRVHIEYIVSKKDSGLLVAEGYTDLAFIKMETKRAVKPPEFYIKKISELIDHYAETDGRQHN
jgi:acyl-CoA thioester hydrolase